MKHFKAMVKIKEQDIVDLFVSACEGGSNYWCAGLTPKGKGDAYKAMLKGFTLIESEDGKKRTVTPRKIERAIQLFAVKAPYQFGNLLSGDADASTGDAFLQLCTFGDLVYG